MNVFFRALTGLSHGYGISNLFSFGQEVAAGGTTNKVWTGLIQVVLLVLTFSALEILVPASGMLSVAYYGLIGMTIGLTYVASVCHANEVVRQTGDPTNIQALPYDLHNNNAFTRWMLFLSYYWSHALYLGYASVLGLHIASGFYLLPGAIVSMIALDQLYQHRWFPSVLETPYFLLSTALQIFVVSGFSNWFWTGFGLLNVGFFAWDYVQTHLRGVVSASAQFPIASERQRLSFDDLLLTADGQRRPQNKAELNAVLDAFHKPNAVQNPAVRVTFNHFREASLATHRLIGRARPIDFNEFNRLFEALDMEDSDLRDTIVNEMALNDKFHQVPIEQHRETLELTEDAELADVQFAYLKQEMKAAVAKLISPSYKALNHQQVNLMVGQANLVLNAALTTRDPIKQRSILLAVAIQAGSQCFRQFSETFSELFHANVSNNARLSLTEKAALTAQSVREVTFKRYYYELYPAIRAYNGQTGNVDWLLTADKHDYHAYENFAMQYGSFFYLQNDTLSSRTRNISDVLTDYTNYYAFLPFIAFIKNSPRHRSASLLNREIWQGCLFSDYYTPDALIDSALLGEATNKGYKNSEKNLHLIFQEWCEAIYPGAYQDMILDEDYYPIPSTNLRLRALVMLMLLDLQLIELVPLKETTWWSRLSDANRALTEHYPRINAVLKGVSSVCGRALYWTGRMLGRLVWTNEQLDRGESLISAGVPVILERLSPPPRTAQEQAALEETEQLLSNIRVLKQSRLSIKPASTYEQLSALLGFSSISATNSDSPAPVIKPIISDLKHSANLSANTEVLENDDVPELVRALKK